MLKNTAKSTLKRFGLEIKRTKTPPEVFFEIDREFVDLYRTALEKTQLIHTDNALKRARNHTLLELLRQTMKGNVSGNVAECGCWRGSSAYQIACRLKERGFTGKFFLFDSFEGLSDFRAEDLENNAVMDREKRKKEFSCSLEDVKRNLGDFSFIEYKKGWIPGRFGDVEGLAFSFVHIDVDLYQPIKDSLEFFYPRMLKGGIIAFDDYGCLAFPGAKRAVDEFMKDKKDFFLHLPSGEAFIIKN